MTQNDRLELFEEYKIAAYKIATDGTPAHMSHQDAKAHALRALWYMCKNTKIHAVNIALLRKRIHSEFMLDDKAIETMDQAKSKKRKLKKPEVELSEAMGTPYHDKRDSAFDLVPDTITGRARETLKLWLNGYNFPDIGKTLGFSTKAAQMEFSRTIKKYTTDLA